MGLSHGSVRVAGGGGGLMVPGFTAHPGTSPVALHGNAGSARAKAEIYYTCGSINVAEPEGLTAPGTGN